MDTISPLVPANPQQTAQRRAIVLVSTALVESIVLSPIAPNASLSPFVRKHKNALNSGAILWGVKRLTVALLRHARLPATLRARTLPVTDLTAPKPNAPYADPTPSAKSPTLVFKETVLAVNATRPLAKLARRHALIALKAVRTQAAVLTALSQYALYAALILIANSRTSVSSKIVLLTAAKPTRVQTLLLEMYSLTVAIPDSAKLAANRGMATVTNPDAYRRIVLSAQRSQTVKRIPSALTKFAQILLVKQRHVLPVPVYVKNLASIQPAKAPTAFSRNALSVLRQRDLILVNNPARARFSTARLTDA